MPRNIPKHFVGTADAFKQVIAMGLIAPAALTRVSIERVSTQPRVRFTALVDVSKDNKEIHPYTTEVSAPDEPAPGFTKIDFVARDTKTGVTLIAADPTAPTNPNFKNFARDFANKNFGDDGTVKGAANGAKVNILGASPQRVVYAMNDDGAFEELPVAGQAAQFGIADGFVITGQVGSVHLSGISFAEIARRLKEETLNALTWRAVAKLASPLVAIARGDFGLGKMFVTTHATGGGYTLEGHTTAIDKDGHLTMKPAAIEPASSESVLLGFGNLPGGIVTATRADGLVDFVEPRLLEHGVMNWVETFQGLPARA